MAPYKPSAAKGEGGCSKGLPTSTIDKSTELFLKQLEGIFDNKQGSRPVKGGLPPHLLRHNTEKDPRAADSALADRVHVSNDSTSYGTHNGGLPPHLLRQKNEKDPRSTSTDASADHCQVSSDATSYGQCYGGRPSEAHTANGNDHSQDMATPPELRTSRNYPDRQQQTRPRSSLTPPQGHPAHATQVVTGKGAATRRAPPTPSYALVKRRVQMDTRPRGIVDVKSAIQGISASRWAGQTQAQPHPPRQSQHWSYEEQPQYRGEQRAQAPVGGIRLSVNAHDDWSSFNRKGGEQQQQQQQQPNIPAPEQAKARKWRPKYSYDWQSQDLPDSVASSLCFSDKGQVSPSEDGALRSPDIRNTVAGELDLVPKVHSEGFCNKNRWVEYPDASQSRGWRPTYCQLWVREMENEDWPVAIFLQLNIPQDEECDVNTKNGWLLPPVDYPDTHIDPQEPTGTTEQYSGLGSRRLMGTASLTMAAQYHKMKRRVDAREGEVKWDPIEDPFPVAPPANELAEQHDEQPSGQRNGQPTPPSTQSYVNRSPVVEPAIIHRPERVVYSAVYGNVTSLPRTYTVKPPPTYMKISCFLRPAEETDIPQILAIYNWEVTHGMQALDSNRLGLKDMERVFQQCKDFKTPIIVAVAGTSAEAKARRQTPVATRGRYEKVQNRPQQQQAQQFEKDKVIGFAFVSILSPGLAGDVQYNVGRFQGQVHIYVTNKCRRKGIGRALLQRITIFCSRRAGIYAQEYEWYDPEKAPTYDSPPYNSRSYSRIFIEFASRAKDDPYTLWMSAFMDTENFSCVSTKDKARKIGYGEKGELVDCLVWQHDCQDLDNMTENDPKRK